MNLSDSQQRQQALNPKQSFIVQAPAGSGKTELLTQRFLTLLSHVNTPEEILAITFTKKSAAEMRDRIIHALEDAIQQKPTETPHKAATRELALKALQQNISKDWHLLENPNRLRIQTIDSFNSWLARQLPTLSQFGAAPEIVDDATPLYREAIHEFFQHLEENTLWSDGIEKLLIHLDNDLNKVEALLMRMLQKRDQWLPYITLQADDPELRSKLEGNLKLVLVAILQKIYAATPNDCRDELIHLAKIAANNVVHEKPDSLLIACKDLSSYPEPIIENTAIWLGLTQLLLTDGLDWRKRFDKNTGFPAATHPDQKNHCKNIKERMNTLMETLSQNEALREALAALRYAPEPFYQDKQWDILAALHQVLKVVVAQLKIIFQLHGKIDYIENANAALLSLGTDEHPTDLALALDYKIQHILVDEFQDTSNNQFRLLEKLTAGWQRDDGRTLFLVGDPMQSIYRFREAEVGLFIRARQHGIRHLNLESLSLSINFRSIPNIVEWVNERFQKVLPANDDIATGAISFCKSTAQKQAEDKSAVMLHPVFDSSKVLQAEKIVEIIKSAKTNNPKDTIVILVRSRNHLQYIIAALKKNGLAYQAIDIDPLMTRPIIQDLIALTKALLHPANRIAWLSILRAPWCGLTLKDLLVLSRQPTEKTIWQRLQDPIVIAELTEDTRERLTRILPILKKKIADRQRAPLREWIESTWQLLGGPAVVDELSDLQDANTYFNLLEKLDLGADLECFDDLDAAIEKLFAAANTSADASLQIMTIHNAKGLEFDTVILPHLERETPNDQKQLLLWLERTNRQLLLAPLHAVGDEVDAIYTYIQRQQSIKSDFEDGRLLYVAATRARKQLHLLFSLEKPKPPANSLLEKLWPAIETQVLEQFNQQNAGTMSTSTSIEAKTTKQIKRLTSRWQNVINLTPETTQLHQTIPGFSLQDNTAKIIGILTHQLIEYLCRYGIQWWQTLDTTSYIKKQLLQLGMLPMNISASTNLILSAINNTLTDQRGLWIIHPHPDAKTEYSLTAMINNCPQQLVIDRTFAVDGIRWIIDYKTSHPDELTLDDFLMSEYQKYEKQMRNYYQAMRIMDDYPIRLGLYFPMVQAWYEWEF